MSEEIKQKMELKKKEIKKYSEFSKSFDLLKNICWLIIFLLICGLMYSGYLTFFSNHIQNQLIYWFIIHVVIFSISFLFYSQIIQISEYLEEDVTVKQKNLNDELEILGRE